MSKFSDFVNEIKKAGLYVASPGVEDFEIYGVSFDSRNVPDKSLFVCKGRSFKKDYLEQAIGNGAIAYVSEKDYEVDIPFILVSNEAKVMPVVSRAFYGDLSDKINIVGITGTKGKTTVTYFLRSILQEYDKVGMSSGVEIFDGVEKREASITTAESLDLYKYINTAIESDCKNFIVEVSSQGIMSHRVEGITFELGTFLNIGLDHISPIEHPTFDHYLSTKLQLFKQSRRACINMDSDSYERAKQAAEDCEEIVSYSESKTEANVVSYNVNSDVCKTEFDVSIKGIVGYADTEEHVVLNCFGQMNVINALAAISMAVMLGVPFDKIKAGLAKARVPGRAEFFQKDGKILVIDFAHNDMSYEAIFSSVHQAYPEKKLILVAGAPGEKAPNRKKAAASIANKYCTHIVITEDDCGIEDAEDICNEIAALLDPDVTYDIIVDRPKAIERAVSIADTDTIVIACGKADQHFQRRGNGFAYTESDVDVAKRLFE